MNELERIQASQPTDWLFICQQFSKHYDKIVKACRYTIGHTPDSILASLKAGECAMTCSRNAVIVTEQSEIDGERVLLVVVAAGDLAEILILKNHIEAAHAAIGITKIIISGRAGWEKVLPDYQKLAVVLTKGFTSILHHSRPQSTR